ncbi:uncharacterized protein LOC135687663 [Rhopilema esculentum]|uniref:uncharacterized protein LOC135687663 n=1 Tax=Rhopilema esculentum TaxID=499914 RepID=UPI0031D4860C
MITILQACKTCGPLQKCIWRSHPLVLGKYPAGDIMTSFGVLMSGVEINQTLITFYFKENVLLLPKKVPLPNDTEGQITSLSLKITTTLLAYHFYVSAFSPNSNKEDEEADFESGNESNADGPPLKKRKKEKKSGRKTSWPDFIDIIVSNEYFKKKLIFQNGKNQKNGEIYGNILKELKKRVHARNENCNYTVIQLRNKFKKVVGECKKAALVMKTASGIKRFQEEKNYGVWFNQLLELVKTRESCQPEQAIEPSERSFDSTSECVAPAESTPEFFIPVMKGTKKGPPKGTAIQGDAGPYEKHYIALRLSQQEPPSSFKLAKCSLNDHTGTTQSVVEIALFFCQNSIGVRKMAETDVYVSNSVDCGSESEEAGVESEIFNEDERGSFGSESEAEEACNVLFEKRKKKAVKKSSWPMDITNNLVDVICDNEYFRKKLIFTNTKTSKNGEIYLKVIKEVEKRCQARREEYKFSLVQTRNKFKKCMSECKKAALTCKSASGIKRFQEDRDYGKWFNQLLPLVKGGYNNNEFGQGPSPETSSGTSTPTRANLPSKKRPFVPIKKAAGKKEKLDNLVKITSKAILEVTEQLKKDPMADMLAFLERENQRSREHEMRLLTMMFNGNQAQQQFQPPVPQPPSYQHFPQNMQQSYNMDPRQQFRQAFTPQDNYPPRNQNFEHQSQSDDLFQL